MKKKLLRKLLDVSNNAIGKEQTDKIVKDTIA